jgi:serine/threonine protein phosphatase PrpC
VTDKARRRLTIDNPEQLKAAAKEKKGTSALGGRAGHRAQAKSTDAFEKEMEEQDNRLLQQLEALENEDLLDINEEAGGRILGRWSFNSETDPDLQHVASLASKAAKFAARGVDLALEDLAALGIGVACTKGLKPESPNQDSFCCIFNDMPDNPMRIYGVFDGHGKEGHLVSNYVKDMLPKLILSDRGVSEHPQETLANSFATMQLYLVQAAKRGLFDCRRSGTTATIVLHFIATQEVVCAHVGDSRCVLTSLDHMSATALVAQDMTTDHRPELPSERERIEAGGGIVRFDGAYNHRVYSQDKRVRVPGLNMSRAFGDLHAHYFAGVSSMPDVFHHRVTAEDKYLVIASDGVWEFVTSQQASHVLSMHSVCSEAAEKLAELSWTMWRKFDPCTVDDITAMVVDLQVTASVYGSAMRERDERAFSLSSPRLLADEPSACQTPSTTAPANVETFDTYSRSFLSTTTSIPSGRSSLEIRSSELHGVTPMASRDDETEPRSPSVRHGTPKMSLKSNFSEVEGDQKVRGARPQGVKHGASTYDSEDFLDAIKKNSGFGSFSSEPEAILIEEPEAILIEEPSGSKEAPLLPDALSLDQEIRIIGETGH